MRDLVPTSPLTSPLYTTHISRVELLTKYLISQPEDGQCQVPKHVVVLYAINYIHISTIIRQIHTLQSSLFMNTTEMTNLMTKRHL
jgi:hypothetical protein